MVYTKFVPLATVDCLFYVFEWFCFLTHTKDEHWTRIRAARAFISSKRIHLDSHPVPESAR
jgi:hypothetical protein